MQRLQRLLVPPGVPAAVYAGHAPPTSAHRPQRLPSTLLPLHFKQALEGPAEPIERPPSRGCGKPWHSAWLWAAAAAVHFQAGG